MDEVQIKAAFLWGEDSLVGLSTGSFSASFSTAFCSRNTFFLRVFLLRVLWLCFSLSGVFEEVDFSWVKSMEKLKPGCRESENLISKPLLPRYLVNSMPLETKTELISLTVSAWVASRILQNF